MRHGKELREASRLRRVIEERVIERFIECDDPHYGTLHHLTGEKLKVDTGINIVATSSTR